MSLNVGCNINHKLKPVPCQQWISSPPLYLGNVAEGCPYVYRKGYFWTKKMSVSAELYTKYFDKLLRIMVQNIQITLICVCP